MKNEQQDKMVSRVNDVISANCVMSGETHYNLPCPQSCDEYTLRAKIGLIALSDHITPVYSNEFNSCITPFEVRSYNDGVLLGAIDKSTYYPLQQYQNVAHCYSSKYTSIEEPCIAIVVSKDTERGSMAILSQVLGNSDKRNLGDLYVKSLLSQRRDLKFS